MSEWRQGSEIQQQGRRLDRLNQVKYSYYKIADEI